MSWSDFHPFVQDAVITTGWVSLLVLCVLLIRKPFAAKFGAKAAYMLWLLPLARFLTPPLPENWSLAGWLGLGRNVAETSPTETLLKPEIDFSTNIITASGSESLTTATPVAAAKPDALPASLTLIDSGIETAAPSLSTILIAQLPLILLLFWIAGTVLWLARSVRQQSIFLQLIADDSEAASPSVVAMTQRIAKQLDIKRVPDIRSSLLCSGPLVTGLKNPVILLPMWFEDDYTPAEQRDALVHELMHLKRRDLWAFQIARIVAATQWFNPLVYIGLSAFRTDQEAACDADVINRAKLSPAAYGRTLVKAARLARPSDRRIAAASLTLAHPIKERLIMMTNPTPSLRNRLLGGGIAIALGAGAVFATASTTSIAQELDGAADADVLETEDGLDLSFSFNLDGETFAFTVDDLPPLPPIPDLPPVPGMIIDQDGNHFSMRFDSAEFDLSDANMAEFATKMEAWGEKMEAWGEVVEVRAEAWAEKAEPQIEAWAERYAVKFENDIEQWAENVERIAEQAAKRAEQNDRPDYDGVTSAETRDFGTQAFNKVEVGSGMKVVYTQDPQASIKATLRQGSWDDVDIQVDGDTLKVSRKGKNGWGRNKTRLTVYAASKNLTSIDTASGSIFEGNLVAQDIEVDASSGSNLSLEGACNIIEVDASSGSNVNFDKFECKSAKVDASSGSNIRVHASNSVDIDASSGSSIRVSGSPSIVKKDTSSGASVRIG